MKNKDNLLPIVLVIGIFFPTSQGGIISPSLMWLKVAIFLTTALYLIVKNGKINVIFLTSLFLMVAILLISTFFTSLTGYAFGTFGFYISYFLMFCLSLRNIAVTNKTLKFFSVINVLIVAIGILTVMDFKFIDDFILKYYTSHKPHLVPQMLFANKPVITFGSHSIASLFIFLLFFTCFRLSVATKRKSYTIFFVAYLFLLYSMKSNSGYLYLMIGVAYLLVYAVTHLKPKLLIISTLIFGIFIGVFSSQITSFLTEAITSFRQSLMSQQNGILGRFGDSGVLQVNIDYIKQNLFRPIGFGYDTLLTYTDSGFIEYVLRGSIFFAILIYLSLFLFLRKNIKSKLSALVVFSAIMMFDVTAYPIYKESTIFYLLPFMIVILNNFDSVTKKVKQPVTKEIIPEHPPLERILAQKEAI